MFFRRQAAHVEGARVFRFPDNGGRRLDFVRLLDDRQVREWRWGVMLFHCRRGGVCVACRSVMLFDRWRDMRHGNRSMRLHRGRPGHSRRSNYCFSSRERAGDACDFGFKRCARTRLQRYRNESRQYL